jgi:hypothetical protein
VPPPSHFCTAGAQRLISKRPRPITPYQGCGDHSLTVDARPSARLPYVAAPACLVLIAGAVFYFRPAVARMPLAPARRSEVKRIAPIAPSLYLVAGGGGNTVVFVGPAGVLVADTKFRESWPRIVEKFDP